MMCPRCQRDPHPALFEGPRRCAFDEEGNFTPKNWNCATLTALMGLDRCTEDIYGADESMQVIRGRDYGGFLVLTRYKWRGCTSSAVHVGDFWPPEPLTLQTAQAWLDGSYWEVGEDP